MTRQQQLERDGRRMLLNLRDLRKARGVTQEQVAAWLQVTQATVSKWEGGDTTAPAWAVMGYVRCLALNHSEACGIFGERPRGSAD